MKIQNASTTMNVNQRVGRACMLNPMPLSTERNFCFLSNSMFCIQTNSVCLIKAEVMFIRFGFLLLGVFGLFFKLHSMNTRTRNQAHIFHFKSNLQTTGTALHTRCVFVWMVLDSITETLTRLWCLIFFWYDDFFSPSAYFGPHQRN